MQQVNGVPVYSEDPSLFYDGLDAEPTWFSAQGGVYRCQSRSQSKTPVAIKKYLVEETDEYPDLFVMPKELVENEIYTMTKCVHPNILKLLAVYLHREFVYLVMPYCTGGSLQQYAFEHHLTIGQLVHIIASIASGLAEVHRHGYIHRDIKCDNIFLVKETNEIVIGDFGVVSVTPAADSNVEEAGVVLFWSPELVQRKIINRKVDIWALGIVILEILNGGRAPYEDEQLDEEEIKQRILENGKPAYPPGLPSRLVNLLDMCLSPEPKTRASANDILKHPFLRDYEPEPLFPVRSAGSDQHESSHDDMSLDDSITMTHSDDMMTCDSSDMDFEDATMANALKKLRALEALHDIDMNIPDAPPSLSSASSSKHQRISSNATDKRSDVESMDLSISTNISQTENRSSTSNTSSSDSAHKPTSETKDHKARPRVQMSDIRRCRLPIRAFTLKEEEISSTTAKEKVLNVLKKRQSISEAHWGQGSRLPMFKAMSPPPETLYEKAISAEKKLRRAKSVRLPKDVSIPTSPEKSVRKPLVRSNTAPSHSTQLSLAKSADKKRPDSSKKIAEKARVRSPSKEETENQPTQRLRPKVLLVAPRHKEEPPKKRLSIYRRKCPPGESRTARLMMGISTTGRRTSRDTTSSSKTEQSPPREVRSLPKMLRFGADTESADKRRLAADRKRLSQNLQPQSTQTTPLPVSDIKARRQSAPAPPKKTTAKDDSTGKSPALKPGVKVLRVH